MQARLLTPEDVGLVAMLMVVFAVSSVLVNAALASADCTVVVTDHSDYDWDAIAEHARLVVDTRRVLKAKPVTV